MFSTKDVLEEVVRKSRRSLNGFALHESFFDTWWVAGGKAGVLKGFSWLEVCFYIQNGLILKVFAFVDNSV